MRNSGALFRILSKELNGTATKGDYSFETAPRTIGWCNGGTNAYSTKERSDANEAEEIAMLRGFGEGSSLQKDMAPACDDESRGLHLSFHLLSAVRKFSTNQNS